MIEAKRQTAKQEQDELNTQLNTRITKLSDELSKAQEQANQFSNEFLALKGRIKDLSDENNTLQDRLNPLKDENNALRRQIKEKNQEIFLLKTENKELNNKVAMSSNKNLQNPEQIKNLESGPTGMEMLRAIFSNPIKEKNQEIFLLKIENKELNNKVAMSSNKNLQNPEQIKNLESGLTGMEMLRAIILSNPK
ncbi:hypothetical protein [Candidatus Protochlamydia amoebophila]|uniref:hypothetical protein n=1 Tax=Candidatus Protochlamydia amoebophila TaxID=362787 RepID=UPI0012BA7AA5|nr:hypothetical protein [Candidatus Protochlamydia amoebophila]